MCKENIKKRNFLEESNKTWKYFQFFSQVKKTKLYLYFYYFMDIFYINGYYIKNFFKRKAS